MIITGDINRRNDIIVSGVLLGSVAEVTTAIMPGTTPSEIQSFMDGLELPRRECWTEAPVGGLETKTSIVLLGGQYLMARVTHQDALRGYRSFKAHLKQHGAFP